jgi:hypothetical protein
MYIEVYLYGLLLGFTVCSACTFPLFFIAGGGKKTWLYLFASRFGFTLLALPLVFILPYIQFVATIAILSVGVYAFMLALEGSCPACSKGVIASGFVCVAEGLPAMLQHNTYADALLNAFLFTLGTVTPLIFFAKSGVKLGQQTNLVLAGMIIVIGVFYLYEWFWHMCKV